MAASPYPQLSDEHWGRLLALGAAHRAGTPVLREFASRRGADSWAAGRLHEDMVGGAADAARAGAAADVVAAMCAGTVEAIRAIRGNPLTTPQDHPLLDGIEAHLSADVSADDPFAALYGVFEEATARLYGDAWRAPETPFDLWSADAHPRGRNDRWAVGAITAPPAAGRGVRLTVCHRELGPEAFAVLPRVLLHELICHVGARDDDPPDPRSPFAEGLMDWASRVYLDRWSYELLGADMHGAATAHAEQSAESFKSGPTSEAREVGYAAASRLRTQRDLQDAPIAALAADVNAAERPRARKDALVLAVLADRLRADMGDLADVIEGERAVEDLLDAL